MRHLIFIVIFEYCKMIMMTSDLLFSLPNTSFPLVSAWQNLFSLQDAALFLLCVCEILHDSPEQS